MTRIGGDWISEPGTVAVMEMLGGAGFQAYFVGGCVRDAIAGRPVSDIDIATDAHPEDVARLAQANGLHHVPTGIEHGTVTVVCGRAYEVTTFRRDVETDGRRAVVAFSQTLEEDARRRDLTINAIYADRHGEITDPVGGQVDLVASHVQFIGEAEERIREDYLRSLRYFRFYALFGDEAQGPDPHALAAISANLAGLDTISKERIGVELLKMLSAPAPAPAVASMAQTGALMAVLPGADHKPLAPLVHFEGQFGLAPDPLRRLAAIVGENPTAAMRLSRADAKDWASVSGAARNGMGPGEAGFRLGRTRGTDAVLVGAALMENEPQAGFLEKVAHGADAQFPLKAADLRPLAGKELGQKLKALEAKWIASDFALSKAELLG